MKRGEVWWAHLDERCPVVLLSPHGADQVRTILNVAPANMKIDGYAFISHCDWQVSRPDSLAPQAGLVTRTSYSPARYRLGDVVVASLSGPTRCFWSSNLSQIDTRSSLLVVRVV